MNLKRIAFIFSFSVCLNVMTGLVSDTFSFFLCFLLFLCFSWVLQFTCLYKSWFVTLCYYMSRPVRHLSLSPSLYMWIPTNSLKFSQLLKLCWKFTPCPLCPTCQFSNQHQKYLCFVDMLIQFLLWLLRGYDLSNPHQLLKILTTSRKLRKIVSLSSLSHLPV